MRTKYKVPNLTFFIWGIGGIIMGIKPHNVVPSTCLIDVLYFNYYYSLSSQSLLPYYL